MTSQDLLDLLNAQSVPLTAAQAAKLLAAKIKAVSLALDDLASSGQTFAFTQGKSTAYATKRPLDLCAEALAQVIAKQTAAIAPAKLKASLHKGLRAWFDEALGRLIVQGKAWWLPKGSTRLVIGRRICPSDVISKAQLAAVQKVLTEANRRRRVGHTLEEFLSWLDAEETQSHGTTAHASRQLLISWYAADRARSGSSMVPIPQTWARYAAWVGTQGAQPDMSSFRAALSEMYDAGEAILEPCERPQDLEEKDRQLQVPLTLGPPGFYWRPLEC